MQIPRRVQAYGTGWYLGPPLYTREQHAASVVVVILVPLVLLYGNAWLWRSLATATRTAIPDQVSCRLNQRVPPCLAR